MPTGSLPVNQTPPPLESTRASPKSTRPAAKSARLYAQRAVHPVVTFTTAIAPQPLITGEDTTSGWGTVAVVKAAGGTARWAEGRVDLGKARGGARLTGRLSFGTQAARLHKRLLCSVVCGRVVGSGQS